MRSHRRPPQSSPRRASPPARTASTLDGATLLREPEAILLRVVAAAIVAVAGARTRPVRLDRFEGHVLGTIRSALAEGGRGKLTLGGALIEIGPDRRIRFSPEPPRPTAKLTKEERRAAGAPHSLGKGGRDT